MKASLPLVTSFMLCVLSSRAGSTQIRPSLIPSASLEASSSSIADDAGITESRADDTGGRVHSTSPAHDLWHGLGFDLHIGVNGAGGDIALPVARRLNVRLGGEYLHYTGHFTEQGADIDAALQVGNGKLALDWFPFGNGFRVSPLMIFANQTHIQATALIPPGETVELEGQSFVSSSSDPLHGAGTVNVRKTAPGLSIGWGNISPHGDRHWSFPVEVGFYYIGQPELQVSFSGSACDPRVPAPTGCQNVSQDADFQRSLSAFIQRNRHNLSYASFFPIASFGVGYRF